MRKRGLWELVRRVLKALMIHTSLFGCACDVGDEYVICRTI